jgi:hypothetical protein
MAVQLTTDSEDGSASPHQVGLLGDGRAQYSHPLARPASLCCAAEAAGTQSQLNYAGIQFAVALSYLYPGAPLRASFVAFIVRYQLPLFCVAWTALNGTATSFESIPRNPPTETMKAAILPSFPTKTSTISPILVSEGS